MRSSFGDRGSWERSVTDDTKAAPNMYRQVVSRISKMFQIGAWIRPLKSREEDLIIDLGLIPTRKRKIQGNLVTLLRHVRKLRSLDNVADARADLLLSVAVAYVEKQIRRLRLLMEDEADIIAWISRTLLELFFVLRYMYTGVDQFDEFVDEQLKDLKNIESVLYPDGIPDEDDPAEITAFHTHMTEVWKDLEKLGLDKDGLRNPRPARYFAEGAGLMSEYDSHWKLHSKYVHPTSFLLLGRKSFVYGDGARLYFWVVAQHYSAWIIRDLYGMLAAIPDEE